MSKLETVKQEVLNYMQNTGHYPEPAIWGVWATRRRSPRLRRLPRCLGVRCKDERGR